MMSFSNWQCNRDIDRFEFFFRFMASARSLHTFNRGKQVNCSLHAGLSICRKPQKCRLWTSTQSRSCPSKRTTKKANQKQQAKTAKNTQPKQKPNKNDRDGIATSNGNYMHDDMCHSENGPKQETNQNKPKTHQRANVGG